MLDAFRFDTLRPINLTFLFPRRKGTINRLALFLRMSKSLVENNKDLDRVYVSKCSYLTLTVIVLNLKPLAITSSCTSSANPSKT